MTQSIEETNGIKKNSRIGTLLGLREHLSWKNPHRQTSWTIGIYQADLSFFRSADEWTQEGQKILERLTVFHRPIKCQVVLAGHSLLAVVDENNHRIEFLTPHAGQELFLVETYQQFFHRHRREDWEKFDLAEYEELKKLTESVIQIDDNSIPSVWEQAALIHKLSPITSVEFLGADFQKKKDELISAVKSYQSSFFEKVSDYGLNLTAHYALLRVHLLKFLVILPSLDHDKSGREVKRLWLESLRRLLEDSVRAENEKRRGQSRSLPGSLWWTFKTVQVISTFLPEILLSRLVRWSVRTMAKRFIAGENIQMAAPSINGLKTSQRDITVDQLGELVVSEEEADQYCNEVLNIIRGYSLHYARGERNKAGILKAHVSIKVSALCSDFKLEDFNYTYEKTAPRLKKILCAALEEQVFVNIDAEHYHYRNMIFEIYRDVLLSTPELKKFKETGIVVQAYVRDAVEHLNDIIDLTKERGVRMPIRLVKGAYWDAETIEAKAHNFEAPQFLNKVETDLYFRQVLELILKSHQWVQLCIASHNISDHVYAESLRSKLYPEAPIIEHQCLHMTYEALSYGMGKIGWVVRNYIPIGSLLVGMAYLVRRIMENSSQVGVLTIMRSHKKNIEDDPLIIFEQEKELFERDSMTFIDSGFKNTPPVRWHIESEKKAVIKSLNEARVKLGAEYKSPFSSLDRDWENIYSSSDPKTLVGKIKFAQADDCEEVLKIANKSFLEHDWSGPQWNYRIKTLIRASHMIRSKRNELASVICFEAGKTLNESLADVDEAIDFINFYTREEAKLHSTHQRVYPRGPALVISPWNFPLAIPCGMICGPLVAGNPVILKPAEQTPLIASLLVDILHESGVPKEVLQFCPGLGESVGAALAKDERIATVLFTGSKVVGKYLHQSVQSRIYRNQRFNLFYPAKVVAEMGGKNAIIITSSADLDEAVSGILQSAFFHSGQKCSAASRLIVHQSIKQKLAKRLSEAITDLRVSKSYDLSTTVNPVISSFDQKRLKEQIQAACEEAQQCGGRVWVDRSHESLPGYCVGPSLIELPKRALNGTTFAEKELFGPILHLIEFETPDEAVTLFNSTDYALTGGIFSQSQDDIDLFANQIHCGNLYINRNITGARVGIEPFGGYKMSGTGPKAGSPQYVQQFHLRSFDEDVLKARHLEEQGTDYLVDCHSFVNLPSHTRTEKLVEFSDKVLERFENYFSGINVLNKEVMTVWKDWIEENGPHFKYRLYPNHSIPGQVSYDNWKMATHKTMLLGFDPQPQFKSFLTLMAALMVGSGVTIICRNESSYLWYCQIKDLLYQCGWSQQSFDVYFINEEKTKNSLEDPELGAVIVDGDEQSLFKVQRTLQERKVEPKHMLNIYHLSDLPAPEAPEDYIQLFIWKRSLAINVMRHGAPLEVEWDQQ